MPVPFKARVFTDPDGPEINRLLAAIVLGKLPEVVASIVTVLVLLLLMYRVREAVGGVPSVQLFAVSHLPLEALAQMLVLPGEYKIVPKFWKAGPSWRLPPLASIVP